MNKLSAELRRAGEQLQVKLDMDRPSDGFDLCRLANFLTDSATRAAALEAIVRGDYVFTQRATVRHPQPTPPCADIAALQAVLDSMAGRYTLVDWCTGSRIIGEKLPTAIAELIARRAGA